MLPSPPPVPCCTQLVLRVLQDLRLICVQRYTDTHEDVTIRYVFRSSIGICYSITLLSAIQPCFRFPLVLVVDCRLYHRLGYIFISSLLASLAQRSKQTKDKTVVSFSSTRPSLYPTKTSPLISERLSRSKPCSYVPVCARLASCRGGCGRETVQRSRSTFGLSMACQLP